MYPHDGGAGDVTPPTAATGPASLVPNRADLTGDTTVDDALSALDGLEHRPVHEHAPLIERVHQTLHDRLAADPDDPAESASPADPAEPAESAGAAVGDAGGSDGPADSARGTGSAGSVESAGAAAVSDATGSAGAAGFSGADRGAVSDERA